MDARTILIADDSRTIRTRVRRILAAEGFELVEADNGLDALRQIERHGIDLAILDIQMPELDGYGVCQELQSRGFSPEQLPVLFLTNIDSRALEVLGQAMGDYLRKPIDDAELIASVQRLLGRSQDRSPPTTATT